RGVRAEVTREGRRERRRSLPGTGRQRADPALSPADSSPSPRLLRSAGSDGGGRAAGPGAGYISSMSCGISPLVQGSEPWVSDWADMTPTMTREAQGGCGPGCWHGMEDKEISFQQSVSVKVAQVRTPKADSSTQKAHPSETCGLVLKDILHLAEHQGTHSGQKPHMFGPCGTQFWFSANHQQKQRNGEKPFRREDRAFLVNSCPVQPLEMPFMTGDSCKDFPTSSSIFQHHNTPHISVIHVVPPPRTQHLEYGERTGTA
ncbi:hypothetical protein MC885_015325, partial [Smutsia gigantea]